VMNVASAEGKLREPVLRIGQVLRGFGASSNSNRWQIGETSNAATSLGQTPYRASSVFNFYRPSYIAPNTRSGTRNITVPEFQITNEVSVAGYLNTLQTGMSLGFGNRTANVGDVQLNFSTGFAGAADAAAMVNLVNLRMAAGALPPARVAQIRDAVAGVAGTDATATLNRQKLAIYLVMASPEYLIQQ
jgi:hypothetical protein